MEKMWTLHAICRRARNFNGFMSLWYELAAHGDAVGYRRGLLSKLKKYVEKRRKNAGI